MGKKSKITPAQKPPSENQIGISNKFDLIDWIQYSWTNFQLCLAFFSNLVDKWIIPIGLYLD